MSRSTLLKELSRILLTLLSAAMLCCVHARDHALTLNENDTDRKHVIQLGESVMIKLNPIPVTRLKWFVSDHSSGLLETSPSSFDPPKETAGAKSGIGNKEIQVFHFKAVQKGPQRLRLSYGPAQKELKSLVYNFDVN